VIIFRIGIALLPQLLLLLLLGARLDLLGGWNRTDAASGMLMVLFLVTPVAAAALLVAEILLRRRRMAQEAGSDSSRSSRMIAFAALVLVESLAIDLLILSQLRMH
jgi:hypothetical protein